MTGTGTPGHLYVHAPFCARRCSYCDFAVHVAADPPVDAWVRSVAGELGRVADDEGWTAPLPLETVYVGGGTPSLLGRGALARLLDALGDRIEPGGVAEFTVEANPESFDAGLARDWAAAGVGRVSFGAQTFHEPSLRWMGRLHGPEGPARAVTAARDAGLDDVSIDLIFGLPEWLGRDLDDDLDRVLALEPTHVSVYGLSIEPATPLGQWVREGRESMPDEERYRDEYLTVAARLNDAGFGHYEVSNFARPGHEARHNAAYWSGAPYLGLGNGAHSFLPPRRWSNRRDWLEYRRSIEAGESPRAEVEALDADTARLETFWLGLRTREGLDRRALDPSRRELADRWVERGWAVEDPERVRLTVEGWLLLDRLAVELDGAVRR